MANDTYTANADGSCYVGMFSNTPLTDFIDTLTPGESEIFTGTNINVKYPAAFPERLDIATFETTETIKVTNWGGKGGYDRVRRKLVMGGAGEGFYTGAKNYRDKAITFPLTENAFTHIYGPLAEQNGGHVYDRNSSIPDKFGRFWCTAYNTETFRRLWARDPITGEYTFVTNIPNWTASNTIHALDVFPEWGDDGGVIVFGQRGTLGVWDIATETWTLLHQYETDNRHYYGLCMYVNGYVVFGGGESTRQLYRLDSNGTLTAFADDAPHNINCKNGGYKYLPSPVDGENACYSMEIDTLRMYRHDHDLDTWTDIGPVIAVSNLIQTVFTPLRGLSAFACFHGKGRVAGEDVSEFWILKVGS